MKANMQPLNEREELKIEEVRERLNDLLEKVAWDNLHADENRSYEDVLMVSAESVTDDIALLFQMLKREQARADLWELEARRLKGCDME